ncbi:MAG: protein strawberry notch 1-like [Gemmatimonadetes bacterium]|nr:protein strawberry notch 1-like [Gemmatimonadota bacterium]
MQFDLFSALSPRVRAAAAVTPASDPAPPLAGLPLQRLLDAAFEELSQGVPFRTPGEAVAWGTRVTDTPYVPAGPWTLDDVYDALEGAAHRVVGADLAGLVLQERLLRTREREAEWFHGRALTEAARAQAQFSTPLPIAESAAYLVAAAASVRTVLEPCAGTGSLARPLLPLARVSLRANETDARRREVLAWLGLQPTGRDALRLPLDPARFDAVLSNPPFGAMNRGHGGRGATEFAATNIAQRFAAAHLRSLNPGGLLVALLPASTLSDAGADFRRWLAEHHTPLLYLGCPVASYRTRGALRDAMLLVALQGKTAGSVARVVLAEPSWDEWRTAIEAVAEQLPGDGPVAVETGGAAPLSLGAGPVALPPILACAAGPAASPPGHRDPHPAPPSDPAAHDPVDRPAQTPGDGPRAAVDALGDDRPLLDHVPPAVTLGAALDIEFASAPPPRAVPDWERQARERAEAEASAVFAPFVVSLREQRAPHPRLVVQTRSMAGMPPPPVVRQGFESPFAGDAWGRAGAAGGASDEQAELSLRVLDAWDRRHGFLCADDVGVGKSRELALLALEAIHEGETRILVTTKNETNIRDLEQELRRVASGDEHGPFPAQFVEVANYVEAKGEGGVLPRPAGAAVYLAHSYNFADFAPALLDVRPTVWLADEAHEYANIADSKRGLAWAALHEAMLAYTPKIAYFTATPAVTLDQLCYLYGLRQWRVGAFDLWIEKKTGKGEPEKEGESDASERAVRAHVQESTAVGDTDGVDADQAAKEGKRRFMVRRNDAFTIRTTPAETEQVMRELQASGHYMSRDLWRGGVTFAVEWIDLLGDPAARRRYDEAAAICRDLSLASRQFGAMNQKVKTQGLDRAMVQSYLKQLLFDLRLDAVLARADVALAEGRQVVISVHSVAGDEDDCEALGADAQEHAVNRRLESAINRINVQEITKETEGNETVYRDLGEIPEALLAREALRERVRALPRLRDPVRVVTQHFGASAVAAITGRIPARLRTQRMGDFQAGTRRVALISKAGKVGISLHDTNGHPRTMLAADYEWSADLFKQELGRVDRTGQRSAPEIVLMASTAAGERKFASTIAARMASLGATCKGSAEATGTDALDQFDMSGGIALEAMKNAVQRLEAWERAHFTGSQFLERQKTSSGAVVWTPKLRPEEGTQMRHFLLEMLMFPMEDSHHALALWEEERDALLTIETLEALSARRTGRARGSVLRERPLPASPPMTLVDVRYEDGEHGVIAQGHVTEHMTRIQRARGPDSEGQPRTRRYLQFTADDGRLVSGLDLTTSEAHRIRWAFGSKEARDATPEALLQDLRVGEKIPLLGADGARWVLHLRRDGRIEVRGAKLGRDRTHLMRPSLQGAVAYEPAGNFLHLTSHDALALFVEHFPVADAPAALAEAA